MIPLNSSMNYDIGFQNTFSPNHEGPYDQRKNHSSNIGHHEQLSSTYPHRVDFYAHTDILRPSPFPPHSDSSKQASIFCPDTASMKEIQTPYEVFKNTTSQRISVGGADAHSRILSRSSEGCMYDPTPSYVNTPSEPLQHLEHSQHYISDCNRLNSDDTSSTSSGTGDSQMFGRQPLSVPDIPLVMHDTSSSHIHDLYHAPIGHIPMLSQPPTPIVGRWRSVGPIPHTADASLCDVLYEKLPYTENNSLDQMYANRTRNTGYYPRPLYDKKEKPILKPNPAGLQDDNLSRPTSPGETFTVHVPKHAHNASKHYPGANLMSTFSTKAMSSVPKRYKCSVCSKRFTRPSSLTTHMYSHTGEKPHKCPVASCGRRFSVVSNLRRHTKIHGQGTNIDDV